MLMMHRRRIPPPSTCNHLLLDWATRMPRDATRVIKLSRFGPVDRAHVRSTHTGTHSHQSRAAPRKTFGYSRAHMRLRFFWSVVGGACVVSAMAVLVYVLCRRTHVRSVCVCVWCLFITVTYAAAVHACALLAGKADSVSGSARTRNSGWLLFVVSGLCCMNERTWRVYDSHLTTASIDLPALRAGRLLKS